MGHRQDAHTDDNSNAISMLRFGKRSAFLPAKQFKGEEKMKTRLLVLLLVAAGSVFAGTHVVVGVGVGGGYGHGYYVAPPPVVGYAAPYPGYNWVGGYWYWSGPHRYWHAGTWAAPRVYGGYGVGPRYYGGFRGRVGYGYGRSYGRGGYSRGYRGR